jgi:hypothetical protein
MVLVSALLVRGRTTVEVVACLRSSADGWRGAATRLKSGRATLTRGVRCSIFAIVMLRRARVSPRVWGPASRALWGAVGARAVTAGRRRGRQDRPLSPPRSPGPDASRSARLGGRGRSARIAPHVSSPDGRVSQPRHKGGIMRFSRPSTGTHPGCDRALHRARRHRASPAGATVVNIADPTTPAHIAHANHPASFRPAGPGG